jgi:hypothetical protein
LSLRTAIINLIISLGLVGAVVIVGVGAKMWRKPPPSALKAVPLQGPTSTEPPKASEKFALLSQPQLLDVRGDQADRLLIRHADGEHEFALYFVEALGGPTASAELVEDQARWFRCESRDIRSLGQDAALYASQQLRAHSMEVLTRWEPTPDRRAYYALVFVKRSQGSASLGEQLLRQGFARVGGLTTPLPGDTREMAAYLADLKQMDATARSARLGIWGRSQ